MRAIVNKRFRDKHTDEVYEVGKDLELTPERYAEIISVDAELVTVVSAEELKEEEHKAEEPKEEESKPEEPKEEKPKEEEPKKEEPKAKKTKKNKSEE